MNNSRAAAVSLLAACVALCLQCAVADMAKSVGDEAVQKSSIDDLPAGARARFGTLRFRHGGIVSALAYSPDGRLIASGSRYPGTKWGTADNTVRVWDAASGEEVASIPEPSSIVDVAFSPDGRHLAVAVGRPTCEVHVWDLHPTVLAFSISGYGDVKGVGYSPDSRLLATANGDGTVSLRQATTGTELHRLRGHTGSVGAVTFSPDGAFVASSSDDRSVKLWNARTGDAVWDLDHLNGWAAALQFTPDGATLACGTCSVLRLVDAATGTRRWEVPEAATCVALSPDGALLAASGSAGSPLLCRVRDGSILKRLNTHRLDQNQVWTHDVAFSPDGSTLLAASGGGAIERFAMPQAEEIPGPPGHVLAVAALGFSGDGATLVSSAVNGMVRMWEVATSRQMALIDAERFVLSPSGESLFAWRGHEVYDSLRILSARTGEVQEALRPFGKTVHRISRAQFSHDGGALAIRAYRDRSFVFALSPDKALTPHGFPTWPWVDHNPGLQGIVQPGSRLLLTMSPTGTRALVLEEGGDLIVFDVPGSAPLRRLAPPGHTLVARLSPDDRTLAVAAKYPSTPVYLYDVVGDGSGRPLPSGDDVLSLAFSPNSLLVAGGRTDGMVRVWRVTDTALIAEFSGHRGSVTSLCFSPNSTYLASGSSDTSILLWPIPTARGGQPGNEL